MSSLPHESNPASVGFTCNTCLVRFVTAELQRQHMRTEWHRYNLKRRVAQLPSILSDVFAEKVLELQKLLDDHQEDEDEYGFYIHQRRRSGGQRQLTKKDLRNIARLEAKRGRKDTEETEITRRSHSPAASVASDLSEFSLGESIHYSEVDSNYTGSEYNYSDSNHSDSETWQSDDGSEDSEDEDDADESAIEVLLNTYCFYCGKNNEELENNVRHMSHYHGLYIPERTYLVDLDGLLTFLNEVTTLDHECLVCGFQGKSLESIRQHIQSKGHCRIPYETKDEKRVVSEFYNFRVDDTPAATATTKKVTFNDVTDTEYVDVSGGITSDTETKAHDLTSDYDSASDDVSIANDDNGLYDNYSTGHVDATGVELTLPTGSRVGHRSMVRYYRQNLPLPREYPDSSKTVALVDRRYAPGLSTGQITKQEKEMRRLEAKARNDYERKTKNKRANYQAHFRDEILGS